MTRPYRTESWFQHAYPDNLSALRDLQHRARLSIPDNVLARQHGRPAGLGHIISVLIHALKNKRVTNCLLSANVCPPTAP